MVHEVADLGPINSRDGNSSLSMARFTHWLRVAQASPAEVDKANINTDEIVGDIEETPPDASLESQLLAFFMIFGRQSFEEAL